MGCVGQIFTWVARVTWVKIFFYMDHNFYMVCVGQNFFHVSVFFYVGQNFLQGSKFLRELFFGCGGGEGAVVRRRFLKIYRFLFHF